MKNIILIGGKKRSGKDFVSDYIASELEIPKISFAEPIKQMIEKIFDITRDEFDEFKNNPKKYKLTLFKDSMFKNKPKKILETNFRKIIQRLGTDASQFIFGKDVWSKKAEQTIKELDSNVVIISDFRFKHEYEYFKERGYNIITIKILNSNIDKNDDHESENSIKDFKFDIVLDNSKMDDSILTEVKKYFPQFCKVNNANKFNDEFLGDFVKKYYWKDILGYMELGISNHISSLDLLEELNSQEKDLNLTLVNLYKEIGKVKTEEDMINLLKNNFRRKDLS